MNFLLCLYIIQVHCERSEGILASAAMSLRRIAEGIIVPGTIRRQLRMLFGIPALPDMIARPALDAAPGRQKKAHRLGRKIAQRDYNRLRRRHTRTLIDQRDLRSLGSRAQLEAKIQQPPCGIV